MRKDIFKKDFDEKFYNIFHRKLIPFFNQTVRIKMILLALIIILLTAFYFFQDAKECPEIECPDFKCDPCPQYEEKTCPEPKCPAPKVETKNIYNYVCADGTIVKDEKGCDLTIDYLYKCRNGSIFSDPIFCEQQMPELGEFSNTQDGIGISIDAEKYEPEHDWGGFMTKLDYTIINNGSSVILPKIELRLYNDNDSQSKKTFSREVIYVNQTLNPGEWIISESPLYEQYAFTNILTLVVRDSLPNNQNKILVITSKNVTD